MWPSNKLTELLGIKYPLIQGPLAGGPSTPELTAAVSNSGGLGSLGAAYLTPPQIQAAIHTIRNLTDQPFAINLFVPTPTPDFAETNARIEQLKKVMQPYRTELGLGDFPTNLPPQPVFEEQIEVVLAEKVPIFSTTFGLIPDKWQQKLKTAGVVTMGTATTVREAIALEQSGVDAIIAQGSEAGGHRGTFQVPVEEALIGTLALVPQVVDNVKVSVIAAGGIMDGRGILAALVLGALAVQMGTAFLTTPESGAHPEYKAAVLASSEENTTLIRAFSGRTARGLRNRFSQEMQSHEANLPAFPYQNSLTRELRQAAAQQNNTDFMSLWAGQGTRLNTNKPASQLIAELVQQVETLLSRLKA